MKRRISLLLVLAMLLSMIPFAAFAEETGEVITSGTAVTASAAEPVTYTWTPTSNGTLTVSMGAASPGWRYTISDAAGNTVGLPKTSSTAKSATFELVGGTTYTYTATGWDSVAYEVTTAAITYTLTFVASEEDGGEVEKVAYEVADTKLALGDNTLTLLDTAVTTIYEFEAPETAVYTFTAPEGAILGYWGAGSWFLSDPKSTTNTYEWTCTGVGQSAYIGVSGVDGEFNLNVAKTGDYTVVETPIVPYENKATLEAFTIPEGAKLGSYVDVYSDTVHTAVYSEADGYYHLDSVDGDVLLVDMNYMDIILSAALKSDRPVMYAYTTDENGNDVKYDIGNAVLAYEAVMDADGYYPLTEDLILFYQVYAVGAGTYTFYVTGDYNEGCVWMYCMRTMNMDNVVVEPSEPETDPSEPEVDPSEPEVDPSEPEVDPSEPVNGELVMQESVTGSSSTKYVYTYEAAQDGTLTITVGDGSTDWSSDVIYFVGLTSTTVGTASGTAADSYSVDVVAGTKYRVRIWTANGAATPVTIVFQAAGAVDPSEPETEPGETEKNPYEVSTTELTVGSNAVTMLDTAVTTVFKFKPTEAGTYTFTAPAGAVAGNWGNNAFYLTDPGSTTNTCEWTCTGVGQSVFIGVSGVEGQFVLTVTKYEEPTEPSEPETEPSEPEETEPTDPSVPSIPDEDVPADAYYGITIDGTTTYYTASSGATLNSALKKITGSAYVKFYKDMNLGSSNTIDVYNGNITIDLNGCTITSAYKAAGALYVSGGNVTLVDTSAEGDGEISSAATNGFGIEIYSGSVTMLSGNAKGYTGAKVWATATFDLKGGYVYGTTYAINALVNSTVNVSGGTMEHPAGSMKYALYAASTATVSVTGGYFNGTLSGPGLNGKISGGYFTASPSAAYIAEGCTVEDNADTTYLYKVVDPNAVEPEPDPEPSEPETEPSEPETEPSEPETEPSEPETEPSEPETEPSEPEPSEPVESGTVISVTNETVTTAGCTYEFTATTDGTLTVIPGSCTPGYRYKVYGPGYESLNMTQGSSSHDHKITAGTWTIQFYAYAGSATGDVDGTVSFDVVFTPDQGGEVVKDEYQVSETELVLGNNTLTLLDTAVTTIYVFEPTETGVYTFTAPEGAILGYWGAGSWFLNDPKSTINTYEWTCTGVGQSAYIGVSGVSGEFTLNVAKTGDYTVVEIPTVTYENKATLETFTLPEGATLGSYVDVYGQTHTAVYNEADGYYHLDSADGPILLVDMNYMDIILSAALKSDRPVMYAYTTDENGNDVKYDIGNAVLAYEAVMDANGYYPLTEDLILFYDTYAVGAGTYTFYVTGEYNEECVWMYCMRTMTLPAPEPVYVAAVYANGQLVASYESLAEAIANCGAGQYVVLTDNVTESVTVNGDLYLDLNGYTVSGITMANGNTLFLFDSATDNYEGTYGTATVTGTVETFVTANGKTYLVVAEDGLYSAHCYAVELTYVSLDPANDALGYKAELKGDEIVCKYVTSFGFNLWVEGGKTVTRSKDFDGDKVFTLRLKGILAANGGEMTINGSAFVIFSIGEETKTVETEAHSTTMKQTLETVNANFDSYTDAQKEAVKELVTQYAAKLEGWSIDKIVAWEPSEA